MYDVLLYSKMDKISKYNKILIVAAVRKEYARRSHEASEEWKQRMQKAEMTLEENDQTYRAVGAGVVYYFVVNPVARRVMQVTISL